MKTERLPMQSVHRALDILEALSSQNEGMGVTALARQLGLKVGTTGNILKVLKQRGFIDQRPDTRYIIGTWMIGLGGRGLGQSDLARFAEEPLEELHRFCGETVFLAVRQRNILVNLIVLEGIHPLVARVQRGPSIGIPDNLHCTAMGKVLLAYLDEETLERVLKEITFTKFTENSITDAHDFKQHLLQVRQQGYAYNCGEETLGVCGFAAPIFDEKGNIIAGVCLGYPCERENQIGRLETIKQIRLCAARISQAMGYKLNSSIS